MQIENKFPCFLHELVLFNICRRTVRKLNANTWLLATLTVMLILVSISQIEFPVDDTSSEAVVPFYIFMRPLKGILRYNAQLASITASSFRRNIK